MALLEYADDLVLIEEFHDGFRILFSRLEEAAKKVGLQINENKTKFVVMGRKDSMIIYPSLRVGNHEFRRVKQFKYNIDRKKLNSKGSSIKNTIGKQMFKNK